jgi:hypothetical protein
MCGKPGKGRHGKTEKNLRFVISHNVAINRKSKQMPPFIPFRYFTLVLLYFTQ